MPPRRRAHLTMTDKALPHDLEFLVIAPVPPTPDIRARQHFYLRCELIVEHKVGFIAKTQCPSDGLRRRRTAEVRELPQKVRQSLGETLVAVEIEGPDLGRPYVDTLEGSRHSNMKELRFGADGGVWRFAFAFDPAQRAVVLVGGDKQGANQRRFYNWLIRIADERFDHYAEKKKEDDQ